MFDSHLGGRSRLDTTNKLYKMEKMMGCCNQAPKGGTGKLSYLLGLVAALFVVILLLAAVFG